MVGQCFKAFSDSIPQEGMTKYPVPHDDQNESPNGQTSSELTVALMT